MSEFGVASRIAVLENDMDFYCKIALINSYSDMFLELSSFYFDYSSGSFLLCMGGTKNYYLNLNLSKTKTNKDGVGVMYFNSNKINGCNNMLLHLKASKKQYEDLFKLTCTERSSSRDPKDDWMRLLAASWSDTSPSVTATGTWTYNSTI